METVHPTRRPRRNNLSLRPTTPLRRPRDSRADPEVAAAFESFYREHVASVYQYALAVLANASDAEDVTQQTFLNAYRAFQRGERPHTPHNWLIKIAHNVCRMRWRQSSRRPQELPLEDMREPVTPEDEKPELDEVLAALARLPFNQRSAIVMRELEDRSYSEIAQVLGTSVSAVEALLFRARTNLRAGRKALGALTLVPVPSSLSSFFGNSGGGVAAAGGAAFGTELVLKAAAVVATGVAVGGLGYKSLDAVATATPTSAAAAIARDHQARSGRSARAERLAQLARARRASQRAGASGASRPAGTPAGRGHRPNDGEASTADAPSSAAAAAAPQSAASSAAPSAAVAAATKATDAADPAVAAVSGVAPPAAPAAPAPAAPAVPAVPAAPAAPAAPVAVEPPSLPAVPITVPEVTIQPPSLK